MGLLAVRGTVCGCPGTGGRPLHPPAGRRQTAGEGRAHLLLEISPSGMVDQQRGSLIGGWVQNGDLLAGERCWVLAKRATRIGKSGIKKAGAPTSAMQTASNQMIMKPTR